MRSEPLKPKDVFIALKQTDIITFIGDEVNEEVDTVRHKKLRPELNDKYSRAYFYSLIHGYISPEDCITRRIFPRYKSLKSAGKARKYLDEMTSKRFLEIGDDEANREKYKANPEIIKTIVRYYALSEREAEIVENIYLNPQELSVYGKKFKNEEKAINEYCTQLKRRTANEIWKEKLDYLLCGISKNVRFLEQFCSYGRGLCNPISYLNPKEIPSEYRDSREPLPIFLKDQMASRIDIDINKEMHTFLPAKLEEIYNEHILTHLCVYHALEEDNNVFPFKIESNDTLKLEFKDYDLCKTFGNSVLKFIESQKDNHIIPELFNLYSSDDKYLSGYTNWLDMLLDNLSIITQKLTKDLKSNKLPIISEIPFRIQLDGDRKVMIERLEELGEYLNDRNSKNHPGT